MICSGISLGNQTNLNMFHGKILTGVRYQDEILNPYIHPYDEVIGNDFIHMVYSS